MRIKHHLYLLLGFFILCGQGIPCLAQQPSVLSQGRWFKIPIAEDGVYAITYSYLQQLGLSPEGINPDKLKVYGYGGGMLAQPLSEPRFNHLPEVSLWPQGLQDGAFQEGDRLIFFAQGPHKEEYLRNEGYARHQKNLYSNHAFVFLTPDGAAGQRIPTTTPPTLSDPQTIRWFPETVWQEKDQINRNQSGREWYDIPLEPRTNKAFEFATPQYFGGVSQNKVRVGAMIQSYALAPLYVLSSSDTLGQITTATTTPGTYALKGVEGEGIFNWTQNLSETTTINLNFQAASVSVSNAYPNYFTLTYPRQLSGATASNRGLLFHTYQANGNLNLVFENAPGYHIWNLDNPRAPERILANENNGTISFHIENGDGHQFIGFLPSNVPTPLAGEVIANQNLGTWDRPDLVIVSHPDFLPAARRLRQFRQNHDQLDVELVSSEEVFNQFSSGRQDVSAIRNMARYVKDHNRNFKYLLLIGKGTYDYLEIEGDQPIKNYLPVYQSRNSLSPLRTYSSDDYLGFLEDSEGEWNEQLGGNHSLDIGVGRIPATTLKEANIVVDKLIHYSIGKAVMGDWRQRILFIADDEDRNLHQRDAEQLSILLDTTQAQYQIRKLYLDSFEQISSGSLEDAPSARKALNEAIFRGNLMVNYTGHGNEFAWAEEGFFREDLIDKWTNIDHLSLFITATCEFGRHDSPKRQSAAEKLLLSAKGGAIGLLTTSRPVFANSNFLVNRTFFEQAFHPLPSGKAPRLGDIQLRTKNRSLNDVNNRNFILLGDPSMRLAYPSYQLKISRLSGAENKGGNLILPALREVTLSGQVLDLDGNPISHFSGSLIATLYDNAVTRRTLGSPPNNTQMDFQSRDNILFRGQAQVTDGQFQFTFILPRNVDYGKANARLHLYAADPTSNTDAQGIFTNFSIESSSIQTIDFTRPTLSLHLNDTTFQSKGITGPNPVLVVKTFDESGISLGNSQIGQSLTAQLDEGKLNNLADFYVSDIDNFRNGTIEYPLFDLTEGPHQITVRGTDVFNNTNTASLPFVVSKDGILALKSVFNYPNPFDNQTTFRFEHNRAGDRLEVLVEVYSNQGNLVRTLEWIVEEGTSVVDGLTWNGNTDNQLPLQSGIYLYRIRVKSLVDNTYTDVTNRMVVIK